MERGGYIYILSNYHHTVLYTGVTSDLIRRIYEHKKGLGSSFTRRYKLSKLLYYESYPTIDEAIYREKSLKKWRRLWKEKLVSSLNPEWIDLYFEIVAREFHVPTSGKW